MYERILFLLIFYKRKETKIMDKETKLAERDSKVIELYGEGKSVAKIVKEVGICNQTVYRILEKYGLHKIKKRDVKPKTNNKKRCPICKAVNNPKEAKFCCMCGADIRNKSDILLENLNKALKVCCTYLPTSCNEEVRNTILDTIDYIENNK